MMTARIPDIDMGNSHANLTLRQELERQPWLTEAERIEAAVEAALVGMVTEKELDDAKDEAYEDGRQEGKSEAFDGLAGILRSAKDLLTELRELGSEDQQEAVDDLLREIEEEL